LFEMTANDPELNGRLREMMKDMQKDRQTNKIQNVPKELMKRAEQIVGKPMLMEALESVKRVFREAREKGVAVRQPSSAAPPQPSVEELAQQAEGSIHTKESIVNALEPGKDGNKTGAAYREVMNTVSFNSDIMNEVEERKFLDGRAVVSNRVREDYTAISNRMVFTRKDCGAIIK